MVGEKKSYGQLKEDINDMKYLFNILQKNYYRLIGKKKIYNNQEAEKELNIIFDYLQKAKPIKNLLTV